MPKTSVIWLHTNRRAFCLALVALLAALAVAIGMAWMSPNGWVRGAAAIVATFLAYGSGLCIYMMFQPRLSYENEHLLVALRPGQPIQVPIDVVECFFLGQGPALLPRRFGAGDKLEETSTIVVRLAESAEAWKQFDVKPSLGLWCDGYITIRGTWCEPITNELLKRLNDNLIAAHREVRARTAEASPANITPAPPTREQEVR